MVYILQSLNKWCLISARIAGFCLILAFCSLEIKTTVLCRLTQALPPRGAAERVGGDGGEDPEQKAGRRAVSLSHRQEVARCSQAHMAEGTQRRLIPPDGEPQPQVSLWGAAGCGQWAEWGLVEPSWQKQRDSLPPLHCAEGAGGLAAGRGWGDPAEGGAWERKLKKQSGWGGGGVGAWSTRLARRLFNEYNVLGTLMSCVHSW